MKVFIYSLRDYDEQDFMVEFCSQYGLEYGYTAETPCMDNLHMAEGYDAVNIITTPTDKAMIDGWIDAGVKCIATRTIGYDHIDYKYAASKGVGVVNVTYSPATVAEYTVMMILMGLRRVKHIRERAEIQDFSLKGKIARELCQCTVGIVGTGRIGEAVIDCLSGFGCKILAYDPFEKESVKERAEYVTLERLLSESDIISLHAPALEGTYHMIDEPAFRRMKEGAGIVNCARGNLIDTEALIAALDSGHLGFACLDVIENEAGLFYFDRRGDDLGNKDLERLNAYSNVIVMPHMAFYTDEAVSNMMENSLSGIKDFFETGACVNR